MYANVCVSRRNIHLWPPDSQCPDVAIRRIPAAYREGPGCLGGGWYWGGGSAAASLGCAPVSTFLLGSVPSESSTWEEERLWAPLCASTLTILPLVPLRAHLLPLPSWLYFWSISLEMHTPLSAKLQVPAWSSQSCVQVRDGGRVTAEQGGATRDRARV